MKPGLVVDKIVDIVSKNGNMLLNIPIKADGTLDTEATHLLKDIGRWFNVNGETSTGPALGICLARGKIELALTILESTLTIRDIRYTQSDGYLYAFVMDWPKKHQNPLSCQI